MSPADQLRVAHLVGLAAIASWLAWAHPGGALPALVVALIAMAGEVLPRGAWRELGSPILTLFAATAAWMAGGGERGAIHALLGTLVASLLLIPARPGVLRMLAPLAVVELVVLGLPGSTGPKPWLAAGVLAPLACLALAADAWLEARLGARTAAPPGPLAWLRWALIPALLAGGLGAASFAPAQRIATALRPGPTRPAPGTAPAPREIQAKRLGEKIGLDPGGPPPKDPTPAARLFLPTRPNGLVYLRLAACSSLQRDLDGGRLRWLPSSGEVELPDLPEPAGTRFGDLVRLGGHGDTVMLPDDGDWTALTGVWADGDGNRWRPELGEAVRSYRVALDGPPRREPEADRARAAAACSEWPPAIAGWPWAEVEDPRWATLPPAVAAAAIVQRLHERCAYDLDPPQGASEPLATFLFGSERDRRGICEHFAGAATLLLRRAGHPSRCVVGYASAEWDGSGIVFRRLHAHAWSEVLLDDGRWQRVEATPPVAHGMLDDIDRTGHDPPPASAAVPLQPRQFGARDVGAIAAAAAVAAALIAAIVLLRRRRRRGRDVQATHRQRGIELVELARSLGVRVTPADTAAAICAAITARTGLNLARELAAYETARFGGGPPPPPWPRPPSAR